MPAKKKRSRRASLGKSQVRCLFRCPIKGYVEFSVWPRKGELTSQACARKLETLVDKPQVPLCEKIRFWQLDGRKSPLGPLPRVKIERE